MLTVPIDPVLFSIGSLEIRYYGLVYVLGFLLILYALNKARKKGVLEIKEGKEYDLVFYLMLGTILGSRLFHVIGNFSFYLNNPLKMFYLWQGGMAFHGGLIGILIAAYLFSKKNNINFLRLADVLTIPAIFVLALGRIMNFINQELIGTLTDVPWCFNFRNYEGCRHPVQLYGAFGRFFLFFFLLKLSRKYKDGFVFWIFVLLMGVGRFFVDFLREDPRLLGLSFGQGFSLVMILIGGYVLFRSYREDLKNLFSKKEKSND
ncbi:MAG: prolipoprotein diacylglyceryl transferase [Nanoarchaeota archaeon]